MAQTLQCGQCGAPLKPEAAKDGFIKCEYCGAITSIRSDSPQQPQAPTASGPQVLIQPGNLVQSVSTGIKAVTIIALLAGILVPLGIGMSIYYVISKASRGISTHGISSAGRRRDSPRQARGTEACMVHGNKDDVADIALLMRAGSGKKSPVRFHFFDGVTGKHISESPVLGALNKARVICLGSHYVAAQGQDLKLHIVSSTSPDKVVSVLLADRLASAAVSKDCARITTDDKTVTQIRLSTGETTRCAAGSLRKYNETPGMPSFQKDRIFHMGPVIYTLKAKRRGIPFLSVSARQKGKTLWKWKLDITATEFGIPAVITPNTLLIVGAAYPEKDFAYLAGLALSTGRKRFSVRLKSKSIATFGTGIQYNGKWVLLLPGDGVAAFDPDSGKLAWHIQ